MKTVTSTSRTWIVAVLFITVFPFALMHFLVRSKTKIRPAQLQTEARVKQRKAIVWILAQQTEDGAWRSTVHPDIPPTVVTSLVLSSLGELANSHWRKYVSSIAVDHAFTFLYDEDLQALDADDRHSSLRLAWELTALCQWTPERWRERGEQLSTRLLQIQTKKEFGSSSQGGEFGGWPATQNDNGSNIVDSSCTAKVLQALLKFGLPADSKPIQNGLSFLAANSSLPAPTPSTSLNNLGLPVHTPYAIDLADQVTLQLLTEQDLQDVVVLKALAWLKENTNFEAVPGLSDHEMEWSLALRGHYYLSLSTMLVAVNETARVKTGYETWREWSLLRRVALRDHMASLLTEYGNWSNSHDAAFEDDPIIATPLLLAAIHNCTKE